MGEGSDQHAGPGTPSPSTRCGPSAEPGSPNRRPSPCRRSSDFGHGTAWKSSARRSSARDTSFRSWNRSPVLQLGGVLPFSRSAAGATDQIVLGNHDYYAGAVEEVDHLLHAAPRLSPLALASRRARSPAHPAHRARRSTVVAYARHGDFLNSPVRPSATTILILRTFESARETITRSPAPTLPALQRKLQELGDRAASQLHPSLRDGGCALSNTRRCHRAHARATASRGSRAPGCHS